MGKNSQSTIAMVQTFINQNYNLRYNVISNRFEYKQKTDADENDTEQEVTEWKELNENDIYIRLLRNHYRISMANLIALLKSGFVKQHNPFLEYFENLPEWDGKDRIAELSKYISLKDESKDRDRFNRQFRKMFIRTIAGALERHENKQTFVIVHKKQNSGKSTFLRWLCPPTLKPHYTEEIGLDKDSLIALAENFIINLDELSTLSKRDLNELKSMMSKPYMKVRLPYDKHASKLYRRCSFVGSTNNEEFLSDDTGNVRWVCFEITKINWSYKKDFDINKIWAQAYALFNRKEPYILSEAEIRENEVANQSFLIRTPEMEMVQMYFAPAEEKAQNARFLTSTEILKEINEKTYGSIRLSSNQVGKALSVLGFEKKSRRVDGIPYPVKGYWAKDKIPDEAKYEDESEFDDMEDLPEDFDKENKLPW